VFVRYGDAVVSVRVARSRYAPGIIRTGDYEISGFGSQIQENSVNRMFDIIAHPGILSREILTLRKKNTVKGNILNLFC